MSKIYVLYHAFCTDGTGSKYAAWKKFGSNATYLAVSYGKPIPVLESGSEIYIIDFSYDRPTLEGLKSVHKSVVVLDHHKTAEEALRGVEGCVFDMNKSGCVLAWEYFHPGTTVPNLLLDIQDRDLWLFKRNYSKQIHAGIQLLIGNMQSWDVAATQPKYYEDLIEDGEVLLVKYQIDVANAANNKTKVIPFLGFKCGIINTTDHQSEIGNAICEHPKHKVDFALCYGITTAGDVVCSFRSIGEFDVSTIAQKFGGGGHMHAAGARITMEMLCKILKGNG
jgi:oligoribonuclease NrnB/cAMP/cGMP phosphodiesterase (DHH superfamily)